MPEIVNRLEWDSRALTFKCECSHFMRFYESMLIDGKPMHFYRCPAEHYWAYDTVSGRWLRDSVPLKG